MGETVEGNAMGIDLTGQLLVVEQGPHLGRQLLHRLLAGAGDRLVGGDHHPLDAGGIMQGLQHHHHLDGGAVGVGDDAFVLVQGDVLGIDLRHHQGHVRVHAPGAGVVHHHRAGRGGDGGILLADAAAGGKQGKVNALKGIPGKHVHRDLPAFVGEGFADGALGGQKPELAHRELAFLQTLHHLLAHRAGGAHHCYLVLPTHC